MKFIAYFAVALFLSAAASGQETWPTEPTPSNEFECPDKNDNIYPHPTDCTKYFVCTNGLAWLESCAPGLYFNPITLDCDWPDLVNCNGSSTVTTPRPTNATTPTPTNGTTLTPTNGTTIVTPTNGTTIVTPTNGTTIVVPTNGTTLAPTNETTLTPTNGTTTLAPSSPNPGDFSCSGKPDGPYPHPTDCEKYYVCVGENEPYLEVCPDGLWFDDILGICNWPELVNCS